MNPQTTVIVPAYNEEQGLQAVLPDLLRVLDDTYEILVVDDGSSDKTAEIAARFPVRLVRHKRNCGKGQAMRTGLAAARGDRIIFIDSDNTYPAEAIPQLAQGLDSHDMVITARSWEKMSRVSRLGNVLIPAAIRHLYGFRPHDPLTGLYGLRKQELERMHLISIGFGIETEIAIKAARMGLRILELPIPYRERLGQTKLRPFRDGLRILRTMLTFILLYNPTITFILPGLALLTLGLVLMGLLLAGPIHLGRITLSIHTTLVAAVFSLAGLQTTVFGVATKLYALAHRFTAPDLFTRAVRQTACRNLLVALGLVCLLGGLGWGGWLAHDWVHRGFGPFTQTQQAEFVTFLVIFGMQLLFSVGFLSIFATELRQEHQIEEDWTETDPATRSSAS